MGSSPSWATLRPEGETRRLFDELRASSGGRRFRLDVDGIRKLFLDAANRGKAPIADFKPDTAKIAGKSQQEGAGRTLCRTVACRRGRRRPKGKPAEAESPARGEAAPSHAQNRRRHPVLSEFGRALAGPVQLYETLRVLSRSAEIKVFYPNAAYPRILQPRSRAYDNLDRNFRPAGVRSMRHGRRGPQTSLAGEIIEQLLQLHLLLAAEDGSATSW